MIPWMLLTCLLLPGLQLASSSRSGPTKEFLTPKEIEKIQEAQEIDARIKVYVEASALRLQTAEDRLAGKESKTGDPFEFFSVEDLMDGYNRILHAVMMNLDDASDKPSTDPNKLQTAFKKLKSGAEAAVKPLEVLKKTAEDQRREELWMLIGKAIEANDAALEGASKSIKK